MKLSQEAHLFYGLGSVFRGPLFRMLPAQLQMNYRLQKKVRSLRSANTVRHQRNWEIKDGGQ